MMVTTKLTAKEAGREIERLEYELGELRESKKKLEQQKKLVVEIEQLRKLIGVARS